MNYAATYDLLNTYGGGNYSYINVYYDNIDDAEIVDFSFNLCYYGDLYWNLKL